MARRNFRGLSVAITGASSGIGAALARVLAREGARLVLGARRELELRRVAEECRLLGAEGAIPWRADVTLRRDLDLLYAAAVEQHGGLDVTVLNAGRGHFEPIETTPPERVREMLEVNFLGVLHGVQAAIPIFRARGAGQIVLVSSVVGKRAFPDLGAYSAAKAAVGSLAEALRVELAGSGIDVTLVLPGATETEFHGAASGPRRRGPVGWVQSAETVAGAIARAIRRPRREVYPTPGAWAMAVLNELAPGVVDWAVRRASTPPSP